MDYVKKALTFLSIILITIGAVGLCGCMSSNEGNINGKTVENGGMKEAVNTEQNYQSQLSPFSNTVKVKLPNGFEFEIPKDDYEALQKDKCPEWYIEKVKRDLNPPKEVIEKLKNEKLSNIEVGFLIPYALGENEMYVYTFVAKERKWLPGHGDTGVCIVSNKTFDNFLLINGINPYTLNKSKYNLYLKEYVKVRKDLEGWFNNTIKGHLVGYGIYGIYAKDFDEELNIYILKNGWGYLPMGVYQYNGTTPINPYAKWKDKYPLEYKLWQRPIDAQLYAQKHKLGIWAIDFNEN